MLKIECEYEFLLDYFKYNPIDGSFSQIKNSRGKIIFKQNAGSLDCSGYRVLSIKNKKYYAHRVAFYFSHGYLPALVDHKDRNKDNNKISNLRAATKAQNLQNSTVKRNNSGFRNVCWVKHRKTWRGAFYANNKYYCKTFRDMDSAILWVSKMKSILHGEFASHSQKVNYNIDYVI